MGEDRIRTSSAFSPEERRAEPVEVDKVEEVELPTVKVIDAPSDVEMKVLRETYSGFPLYKTVITRSTFIYTVITKQIDDRIVEAQTKLAQKLNSNQMDTMYRERVLQNCILWPRDFSIVMLQQMPAGVEYTLFSKILAASGMNEPIFGDELIVEPVPMAPPTDEELSRIKANPRFERLGLVKRKIRAVVVGQNGLPESKEVGQFIYTAIERLAYNNLMQDPNLSPVEADRMILKYGLVWPKEFDWDSAPAGWSRLISQGIMELSGFLPTVGAVEDEELI